MIFRFPNLNLKMKTYQQEWKFPNLKNDNQSFILLIQYQSMLEDSVQKEEHRQKLYNAEINTQIVKLIQNKTSPLNKLRYLHLQKINKTNVKQTTRTDPSTPQMQSPQLSFCGKEHLPSLKKSKSSRIYNQSSTNTLLNRLKSVKDLKSTSRLLCIDQMTSRCFENLRATIIASERSDRLSLLKKQPKKKSKVSQGGKRQKEKEHLIQLSKRAQNFLRAKKHELRKKYCRQEQFQIKKKPTTPSQIQLILNSFTKMDQPSKDANDSIQLQLLSDIQQTMLEEKINRIKKDINHKKIVQLR